MLLLQAGFVEAKLVGLKLVTELVDLKLIGAVVNEKVSVCRHTDEGRLGGAASLPVPWGYGQSKEELKELPPAPRVSGLTDTRLGQSPWDFQLCLGCWKDLGGIAWKESWQRRVRTHQPQDQHGKREICTEQVEADLQWAQCPKGFSIMDLFLQI